MSVIAPKGFIPVTDAVNRIGNIRYGGTFQVSQSDTETRDVLETLCKAIHSEPRTAEQFFVLRDSDGRREKIPPGTWLTDAGPEICLSGRWIKPPTPYRVRARPETNSPYSVFISCEFMATLERDAKKTSATERMDEEDVKTLRLNARDKCEEWLKTEVFPGRRQTKKEVRDDANYEFGKHLGRRIFDKLWAKHLPDKWKIGGRIAKSPPPNSKAT